MTEEEEEEKMYIGSNLLQMWSPSCNYAGQWGSHWISGLLLCCPAASMTLKLHKVLPSPSLLASVDRGTSHTAAANYDSL